MNRIRRRRCLSSGQQDLWVISYKCSAEVREQWVKSQVRVFKDSRIFTWNGKKTTFFSSVSFCEYRIALRECIQCICWLTCELLQCVLTVFVHVSPHTRTGDHTFKDILLILKSFFFPIFKPLLSGSEWLMILRWIVERSSNGSARP